MEQLVRQFNNIGLDDAKLTLAELYTGTGGFSCAFESTGKVRTIFANDFDKRSKLIFDVNFDADVYLKDLNEIDVEEEIPKMDILTGGFNCQPFSMQGKQMGFEDERTTSFSQILKIMRCHRPRFVVLENVKNLKFHDESKSFRKIKDELRGKDYKIKYKVLNTRRITDIPQNRERIYIVCFRDKRDHANFVFPKRNDDMREMHEFLEEDVPRKYYFNDRYQSYATLREHVTEKNVFYRYRQQDDVRRLASGQCPTLLTSISSVPIIKDDVGIRRLTPRECFNLQGFPKDYNFANLSDTSLYKLAGNAISVPVVKKIAAEVVRVTEM